MPEYDKIKAALQTNTSEDFLGEPVATADAILKLVDAENPPLHLFLGKKAYPWVKRFIKNVLMNGIDGMMSLWQHTAINDDFVVPTLGLYFGTLVKIIFVPEIANGTRDPRNVPFLK